MSEAPARCGVIGFPLAHTRSSELHRAFAEQCRVAQVYDVFAVPADEFENVVRTFFADGGWGLNVTLPHKSRALESADSASARAVRAGAANVLTRRADGTVHADNVDGVGFLKDLARLQFDLRRAHVCVLGAGGAAAGIIPALLEAGVKEIAVLNRHVERARSLVARMGDRRVHEFSGSEGAFDLLVNATSASLANDCPDFPVNVIKPGTLAYDLVYAEQPTAFMRRVEQLDARACEGWGMLVEQAAETFCLWHGIRPDTGFLHERPVRR